MIAKEEKVTFDFEVKYGTTKIFNFSTYYEGVEVNKLEYVSWTARYKTIWESYKPWFIVVIVIVSVIAVAFILLMLITDLELDDVVDFFEDHLWTTPTILITFIPYFIVGISSRSWGWIPPIIIGGGILLLALVGLIALGIKYLFTDVLCLYAGLPNGNGGRRYNNPTIVDENGNALMRLGDLQRSAINMLNVILQTKIFQTDFYEKIPLYSFLICKRDFSF